MKFSPGFGQSRKRSFFRLIYLLENTAIESIRNALREAQPCLITLKNYRKDGMTFWNELFISPGAGQSG